MLSANATENQDYIYTISVQGHGDYPDTPVDTIIQPSRYLV